MGNWGIGELGNWGISTKTLKPLKPLKPQHPNTQHLTAKNNLLDGI
ncbi:MAG: hypothetical protein O9350_13810 [Microcystis sp. LE19-388.1G]|nr:hypothetical protein [Microcystis sp. LE19-388.1G]